MKNDNLIALVIFFALGICPLLAGLAFFWGAGTVSNITCTRLETTHVNCHIERAFLGIIPTDNFTISKVTGTELITNCEDDGCTYAINLIAVEQEAWLNEMATSELRQVEAEQERLDQFLNDVEETVIQFNNGPTWGGMIISIPFIVLGVLVIIWGLRSFNKKMRSGGESE